MWVFGIVLQDLPDLADGAIDTVIGIEGYALSPDSLDDLLARNQLASLLHQQEQEFHGNAFQLEHTVGTTQLVGAQVELKILPEPD
jgi:hypothetical protein